MFNKNWKSLILIGILVLSLGVVGCGSGDSGSDDEDDLGAELEYTITGIDAGAGVVRAAEQAVEDYDLDFEVKTSSGAVMTQALGDAIENEEPIIVTGWTPHWKFVKYDLKYLEDTKGSFGEDETINTIARLGL